MPRRLINGTQLFFEVAGHGPPLVLVHGSWAESPSWDFVFGEFGRSHRVIRYDRRGHGNSGGDPVQGTIHDDVDDVAELIRDLRAGPARAVMCEFPAAGSVHGLINQDDLPPIRAAARMGPSTQAGVVMRAAVPARARKQAGGGGVFACDPRAKERPNRRWVRYC
jgi:alpha-beta hydrolase superfamily lysophospholipase